MYTLIVTGEEEFTLTLDGPVDVDTLRRLTAISKSTAMLCYYPEFVGIVELVLKSAGYRGLTRENAERRLQSTIIVV